MSFKKKQMPAVLAALTVISPAALSWPASVHAFSFDDLAGRVQDGATFLQGTIDDFVKEASKKPEPRPSLASPPVRAQEPVVIQTPVPQVVMPTIPERQPEPPREEVLLGQYSSTQSPRKEKAEYFYCQGSQSVTFDDGLSLCDDPNYHGFSIRNSGSPRVNPRGGGIYREYSFHAPDFARQEINLYLHEQSLPDGNDSAISMETQILFFPRNHLSKLEVQKDAGIYHVTLTNGEEVDFDSRTHEIVSGVLVESAPIDSSQDRNRRKFAALEYRGRGIMLRSDQRGESPRSAVVWGAKKKATVTYNGKTCQVSNAEIWDQNDSSGLQPFKFRTDEEFYRYLKARCGWDVSAAILSR